MKRMQDYKNVVTDSTGLWELGLLLITATAGR